LFTITYDALAATAEATAEETAARWVQRRHRTRRRRAASSTTTERPDLRLSLAGRR
jgi:hypothetical protein